MHPGEGSAAKVVSFCPVLKCISSYLTNSVDPDQNEHSDLGPLCLPAYLYKTNNGSKNMQQTD